MQWVKFRFGPNWWQKYDIVVVLQIHNVLKLSTHWHVRLCHMPYQHRKTRVLQFSYTECRRAWIVWHCKLQYTYVVYHAAAGLLYDFSVLLHCPVHASTESAPDLTYNSWDVGTTTNYLAICLKWNLRRGLRDFDLSRSFFHTCTL